MSRWRVVVVICLLVLPFLLLAGVGTYYLWSLSWGILTWSVMVLLMGTGYVLAWRWQEQKVLLRPPNFEDPPHWTDRDSSALKLVEARASAAAQVQSDKLMDPATYLRTAQEMAQEIATFYHPKAKDPVSSLTFPEVLAVIELAAHDLAGLVDEYLPGGHLMTIADWRRARQAAEWVQSANNLYWAVAALFNPLDAALRYSASRLSLGTPLQMLQQNLILWFYVSFIERVGHYLIEVNSGRLRVGTKRYLELLQQRLPERLENRAAADPAEQVRQVTVTLLGQVKAGKSSLINGLLGERKAFTDVLPATEGVERYDVKPPEIDTHLVLLDTVGYAHTGPKADQVRATQESAQQSDLLLLVLHGLNPGRQADLELLKALKAWFVAKPDLRRPPILAVVTHLDLLSPKLEWAPPYNWEKPERPKEKNIYQALETVRDQLGDYLDGVVPVCLVPGKVWGVEEYLLPAIAGLLDDAHGVALLRCLKAEKDTGKVRKVFQQLLSTGLQAARIIWENAKAPANKTALPREVK
jgi:predicted GTPase